MKKEKRRVAEKADEKSNNDITIIDKGCYSGPCCGVVVMPIR